ncbi:hypothetical protein DM992_30785 [Burkholderia sp. JP2-270]|nr:hypothetical protein DM992_30785 [Burkholderia sp. JP2-270]
MRARLVDEARRAAMSDGVPVKHVASRRRAPGSGACACGGGESADDPQGAGLQADRAHRGIRRYAGSIDSTVRRA